MGTETRPDAAPDLGQGRPLRAAVIGAGRWAASAHLPAFIRCPGVEVAVLCDRDEALLRRRAEEFGIADTAPDAAAVLGRDDIDIVDVCTRDEHDPLVFAALEAGKHCLVEKPVAHDAAAVWRADRIARRRGLRTKVGLTFRYAPAMRHMLQLVAAGFCGRPFIFNGYEQNSQWLDPDVPADKRILAAPPEDDPVGGRSDREDQITVSSLEGYGAPIIDLAMLMTGQGMTEVVGVLQNFVPFRRRTNLDRGRERINIDDGDVFIGRMTEGGLATIQSSYVTVGSYPGIEARLFGDRGAIACRLVDERGTWQRLWTATAERVEFQPQAIPAACFPPGTSAADDWPAACYGNLVQSFVAEIRDPQRPGEGDFAQAARVQEVINAVEASHRRHGWVAVGGGARGATGPRAGA